MNQLRSIQVAIHVSGILLLGLILAGGYFIGYAPRNTQLVEHSEMKRLAAQLDNDKPEIIEKNRVMTQACQAYNEQLSILGTRMPRSPEDDRLIAEVGRIASLSELELLELDVPSQPANQLDYIILRVGLRGRYPQICDFLARFNAIPRLQKITLFSIHELPGQSQTLDLRMEIQVFYRNESSPSFRGDAT